MPVLIYYTKTEEVHQWSKKPSYAYTGLELYSQFAIAAELLSVWRIYKSKKQCIVYQMPSISYWVSGIIFKKYYWNIQLVTPTKPTLMCWKKIKMIKIKKQTHVGITHTYVSFFLNQAVLNKLRSKRILHIVWYNLKQIAHFLVTCIFTLLSANRLS